MTAIEKIKKARQLVEFAPFCHADLTNATELLREVLQELDPEGWNNDAQRS